MKEFVDIWLLSAPSSRSSFRPCNHKKLKSEHCEALCGRGASDDGWVSRKDKGKLVSTLMPREVIQISVNVKVKYFTNIDDD